jgi:hypothetical protein
MSLPDTPFISGTTPVKPYPLARFLPPYLEGSASAWLREVLPLQPGQADPTWVIDPFGASPRVDIEAARSGYQVLVAANNPIARFLLEMTAHPPSEAELQAVLAELAASSKGDERMEPHIRGLYTTTCSQCAQPVMVEAFLWEKGAAAPFARIYSCSNCGANGEFPTLAADAEKAHHFASGGLHRARALERIASADDPDRIHAEEALSVYLPRAVYALFTLINKLDGLNLPQARRDMLAALLLTACDQANTLWQHPPRRERPRQLTIPPKFRENNIWLALERSLSLWASDQPPVPLTLWPELPPPSGGICLFEGRLRDLEELAGHTENLQKRIGAVLAVLPRQNQAFWTLSALWSGWLWGRQSVGPFKSVLRRRRYDWAWHTAGLTVAFNSLIPILSPTTPILGLVNEAEAGFLSAALLGADLAGLELRGLTLRSDPAQAQVHWQLSTSSTATSSPLPATALAVAAHQAASQSAQEFLRNAGQPAPHLPMHTAALTGIVVNHTFRLGAPIQLSSGAGSPDQPDKEPSPAESFSLAQSAIRDVLTYRGGFLRLEATESAETGYWWLKDSRGASLPAADHLEKALVTYLLRHPGCHSLEIEAALNNAFPGLLTPDLELIHVCLDSYALEEPPGSDLWRLRPQESPAARRSDIEAAYEQLASLAKRLGYTMEGQPPVWVDEKGQPRFWFYLVASAVIGEIMLGKADNPPSPSASSIIVLPGGRANLVAYKLRHDPRLRALCAGIEGSSGINASAPGAALGWRFLKFRHLRQMLDNLLLQRDNLEDILAQDALTYTVPQMRLF